MTSTMLPPEVIEDPQMQHLLGRSALYEALALMLAYPASRALDRADVLLEDLVGHEVVVSRGLGGHLDRVRSARQGVDVGRLGPVHFVLFEGSVLCSPHETEYIRDSLAKGAQLADIAGFYKAFGLKVSSAHPTTPDEIATELEFMALITRKEAYALARRWDERAAIGRAAGRKFLAAHLGRWTASFAADLCGRASEAAATRDDPPVATWFHAVGDLLRATVASDLAAFNIYPSLLTTRHQEPDADSMVCPLATARQVISDDEITIEDSMRATGPANTPLPEVFEE